MIRGSTSVSIDVKGRFVMPTRYREHFRVDDTIRVVLTIDTKERCLLVYPQAEWLDLEERLAGLPNFNSEARLIQRLLIGHATIVDLDNSGRILLPPLLRDYACLSKFAVLVGQGKKFELWDEAHWNACRSRWLQEASGANESQLPEEMKSISL